MVINATTRTLDALRRRGIEVLDLTIANPTHVGLDYPADLLAPLASPQGLSYDPQPMGMWSAREAVAADFARRGLEVPPDRVALTASTSEAYAWLFKLLCDPGDAVLVPQPSYPLFEHLTNLESVTARPYRLEYHGSWRIDLPALHAAIDNQTRAVLVVSPNNPTGSFLQARDLQALDELCAARDLLLIGDEVFADYPLSESPHATSVMHATESMVCSLGGLSKTVGLPQIKLGWIGFGGPSSKLDELMPAYELIADTFLSVSTPAQIALPHLLSQGAHVRRQIQTRIARNLQHLREAVVSSPAISLLQVEGGWSATLQVPSYRSEEALVIELLTADHVLVHPGFFFDFEREAFIVVSLLTEPEEFDRGIARVVARASQPGAVS
ncbi:MAG TPA: pyridoxal phosphate-dependent aminotransferase [Vicinamibacterales bacterium]|nr:pyridoxal phosphate-dependent aminotransferase [Vicinamibacterales bacterium]